MIAISAMHEQIEQSLFSSTDSIVKTKGRDKCDLALQHYNKAISCLTCTG
jgi:hypothetical protein